MARRMQLPPEILAIFRDEAKEHLEDVAAGLEQLGASGDPVSETEHRVNLKRKLHNVKGAANSVGFASLGKIAHAAEDRLATVADGDPVPRQIVDDLFAAVHWLLESLEEPGDPPAELQRRLGLEVEAAPEPEPEPEPEPAPEPAGKKRKRVLRGTKKTPASSADDAPGEEAGPAAASGGASGGFIRVKSTALEQVLSPVAALAMLRVQGRRDIDRLEELALLSQRLADRASEGRLGPEEIDALRELGEELELQYRHGRESSRRTDLALTDLEDQFRRMRLVPFQSLETSLRLTLREACEATGKQVRLEVEGAEAGLDRRHLELLKPPLMHMLRNSVDHGIELPEARTAQGEDPTGTVLLRLETGADRITVVVEDDGAGMDVEAISRKALERGLVTEEELAGLSQGQIFELACSPGFSTARKVTQVSGRGVGLDVVRTAMEREGGSLSIEAREPKGTRFLLSLPASLLTTNVLRVTAGGRVYALPVAGVESTSRVDPESIFTLDGRPCVEIGGRSALVHRLQGVESQGEGGDERSHAVVIVTPRGRVAVLVDRILGDDEMVVRALGPPYRKVRGVLGATIGEEGQVVPVLNPVEIFDIDQAGIRAAKPKAARVRRAILVVDDSITTRTLERHVLESHGYLVQTASDGSQAFEALKAGNYDLVVSDVEMPVLDGIGLARKIRADPELGKKPLILVTSLGSEEDEERGRKAGADAYIVKSRFDQTQLLQTIAELLGDAE
ncbi:MAG: response regulator [Deltaproteobacteria bacterium]|nr:response regulator [Deltaproteobacteria bacterium]